MMRTEPPRPARHLAREDPMSESQQQSNARDGWITLALTLALWLFLLAVFLGVGHEIAVRVVSHH
jgi:hypothetical protein